MTSDAAASSSADDARAQTGDAASRTYPDIAASDAAPWPRRRMASGSPYEPRIGFSRAIAVDGRVIVSGTGPVWPDGSCDPDPHAQARRCLEIIEAALREGGLTAAHVVRTRMYIVEPDDADAVGRAHGETFGTTRPAATMVVVKALLDPRWKVEIEAEAQA